ncbi:MAG: Fic family protein [Verrucomicrobiaceae bacterium]|nr:Fic family protein [Verrucomicrobiaceae bacterium]
MPDSATETSGPEFDAILQAVAEQPAGATFSDLASHKKLRLSTRTLQRRLERLVAEKRLIAEGATKARRYHLPTKSTSQPEIRSVSVKSSASSVFGAEAQKLRALIRRPLTQRTPVGYQGRFLESYQPNKTFYLPAATRKQLLQSGQVGLSELPAGTYLRQVLQRLLVDLSWNSSRLEGNTYSLLETQRLLELGTTGEGHSARETQMILNHKQAIEMLAEEAEGIGFNRHTICNLHAMLSDNLMSEPEACGRLRSRAVGISGTVFHPLEVPQLVEQRFDQLLAKAEAIRDPFEQAFFVMVHLPYLQPFDDVNKRVSRLAANIPLIRHNLCPLSFIEVEAADYVDGTLVVYEQNRVECLRDVFVWAYQRSCARYAAVRQSLGDPDPFRLKHRAIIGDAVRAVVQGKMNAAAAKRALPKHAATLPAGERVQFIEVVQKELSALHPGSIMRYRLRPSEFEAWKKACLSQE